MNEQKNPFSAAPTPATIQGGLPGRGGAFPASPDRADPTAFASQFDVNHSDNGFDFVGEDSMGELVRGFVQTTEIDLAEKELERAGISVRSISAKRGTKKRNRRPTGVEFATLAEQFGDLMEIGESPTQVCRLLSFAQTNTMLAEALLDASDLVINGRSLSEAFAAQRDHNGEPLFPITFICALRIGEEVGTASDFESGTSKSAFLLTLHRFAEAEKKADAIRSSIRSAMMYPIAVILFCVVAVGIVEYYVMPKMVELYTTLLTGDNAQLPLITRIMIAGSDFLISWWGIGTMIAIVIGAALFVRWSRSSAGSDALKGIFPAAAGFWFVLSPLLCGPDAAYDGDAGLRHSVDDRAVCRRRANLDKPGIRKDAAACPPSFYDRIDRPA